MELFKCFGVIPSPTVLLIITIAFLFSPEKSLASIKDSQEIRISNQEPDSTIYLSKIKVVSRKLGLNPYASFRLRHEYDGVQLSTSGLELNERSRIRIRALIGAKLRINEIVSLVGEIRTGEHSALQSANITIHQNGNLTQAKIPFSLSKAHLKMGNKMTWIIAGKQPSPLSFQHDLFWGGDINLPGLSFAKKHYFQRSSILFNTGVFTLRVPSNAKKTGFIKVAQLKFDQQKGIILPELYASWINISNVPKINSTVASQHLQKYNLIHLGAYLRAPKFGTVGFDFITNTYKSDHNNHQIGVVFHAKTASSSKPGKISVAYTVAHIPKHAVLDYLAQNDWARWDYSHLGTSLSALSNFSGHALTLKYQVSKKSS